MEAPCLHFHPGILQTKMTHVCNVLSGKYKRGILIRVKWDSSSAVWSVDSGKPGLIGKRVKKYGWKKIENYYHTLFLAISPKPDIPLNIIYK